MPSDLNPEEANKLYNTYIMESERLEQCKREIIQYSAAQSASLGSTIEKEFPSISVPSTT
jgi:hypothetical protein